MGHQQSKHLPDTLGNGEHLCQRILKRLVSECMPPWQWIASIWLFVDVFVNNVFVNNVFVTTTPCVKQSKAGRALRPPWVSALPQDVPTTNDSPLHPVCIAPLTIAQMLIPHRDCIICLGIILIIEEELTVQFEEQPERVVSSKLLADLDCFPKMS